MVRRSNNNYYCYCLYKQIITLLFVLIIASIDYNASTVVVNAAVEEQQQQEMVEEVGSCINSNNENNHYSDGSSSSSSSKTCSTTTTTISDGNSDNNDNKNLSLEQQMIELQLQPKVCQDMDIHCKNWASKGECEKNEEYMHNNCAMSCNTCNDIDSSGVLIHHNTWGVNQEYDTSYPEIYNTLYKSQQYMINEVYVNDDEYSKVRDECQNLHPLCAQWATFGECKTNVAYMTIECAPSCLSCKQLDFNIRCPFDPNTPKIWKSNDLNTMFTRITSDEYYQQYQPVIHSKPSTSTSSSSKTDEDQEGKEQDDEKDGPWVITLENLLTDEECDILIQLGSDMGYERSLGVSDEKESSSSTGRPKDWINPGRTSSQTWCMDECYNHTITQRILSKIENITGIPDTNSEYLQLLKYNIGQEYQEHHDYIPHHMNRSEGVRLLTVFLYLNDVDAGGGTRFPLLDITVMPKKGKALIWPSVLNDNPDIIDERTNHQALPVENGIKYGANAWLHARDVKELQARGCSS